MTLPIPAPWQQHLKRWLAFAHDLVWVTVAILVGYLAHANFQNLSGLNYAGLGGLLLLALPVQAAALWACDVYRGIWRFTSLPDVVRILKAVAVGTLIITALAFFLHLQGIPRAALILYPALALVGITGPRLTYRWIKDHRIRLARGEGKRTLIIGAGRGGEMLVRDLLKDDTYLPVGLLDDAPGKKGSELHGVRVLGPIARLEHTIERLDVDLVVLAIPTAHADLIRRVTQSCTRMRVACATLPTLQELAGGPAGLAQLRDIRIEDLLGRPPVGGDTAVLKGFLKGRRVLVTGAAGSIGSELCRQILAHEPEKLIMVDHSEFGIYNVDLRMHRLAPAARIESLLGDVRDVDRMRYIFQACGPEVVFHAAAYKHVPLVEQNVVEGLSTNLQGTCRVADLAVEFGVEKFLLVSTDKAVNPSNVMGASKRAAEIYCQALQGRAGSTRFIITRFGNVLDSAGSVVPLFREQIEAGGPVTVTHPQVTRFFMTIPEAVSLILQSAAMGEGGEVFVLDMGEPIRIIDLARQMIRLYGLEPELDIPIQYIGLRPGEKLHEELFHAQENLIGTVHAKILQAQARSADWEALQPALARMVGACGAQDAAAVRAALKDLVPEYAQPTPADTPPPAASEGSVRRSPLKVVHGADPR
ncbi:polysaccharide biosynthesis protein [Ectothiorhodospira variabilis]|uniref:polysaccharide biosynthesis protein n=1 Tax=Ectothiorhodospira variabilis TaxID=505694 RepID=UPI001EFC1EEE|nr:polysaccharide biosynthesis protein [Ectothiorhodospira variabilis]